MRSKPSQPVISVIDLTSIETMNYKKMIRKLNNKNERGDWADGFVP
jgi:hypothetical protein